MWKEKLNGITRVILYLRVSDPKQVKDGNGLDSQEVRACAWAKMRGYEIVRAYREEGESGALADRTELTKMMNFLEHSKEKFIVLFDDESRVARNTKLFLTIWERLEGMGHFLATVNAGILDPENDKLITTIKAAVAEDQRRIIRTKSMSNTDIQMHDGFWVLGHVSRGYKRVRIGKFMHNVRDEPSATVLADALQGFAKGKLSTQLDVLNFINNHPKFAISGMPKANHNFVRSFLTSPIYTGWFAYPERDIPYQQWKIEPLISLEEHKIILDRLNGRYTPKSRKYNMDDEIFPLRRQVLCSICGIPLTGSCPKGGNGARKKYPSYTCRGKGCVMAGKTIRPDDIHGDLEKILATYQPKEKFLKYIELKAMEVYKEGVSGFNAVQQGKRDRINAIESEQGRLSRAAMNTKSDSMRERYEQNYEELETEKTTIKSELDSPVNEPISFDKALPIVMDFVSKPLEIWHGGNLRMRQGVLNFYFDDRLAYDRDNKFRTPKLSQTLAMFHNFSVAECDLAFPPGIEPGSNS
ncbi:recombinase family protein [Lachnospiraceae bacterium OttesenSCG-928-E19]|nr:recombinase family protein [Lachnospiraceae bacterium OttesenSCG-928-E19]